MKNRERFSPPAVGGSSLLVIFAVLCLTVFALLCLGSVQAQKRLSDASVRAVTAYYEADLQAESIFARLRNGERVDGVRREENRYYYICAVSDSQELVVELCREEQKWTVLRWQTVPCVESAEDDSPAVWDGGIS